MVGDRSSPSPTSGGTLSGSRTIGAYLGVQTFIKRRGTGRWLAHQAVFWGVLVATLMTFTLAWGWIHFEATPMQRYQMFLFDIRLVTFDPQAWWAWSCSTSSMWLRSS